MVICNKSDDSDLFKNHIYNYIFGSGVASATVEEPLPPVQASLPQRACENLNYKKMNQ